MQNPVVEMQLHNLIAKRDARAILQPEAMAPVMRKPVAQNSAGAD
jgi:hypothetical protein